MKPVVVLFDFDGVIVDTESQYTVFWGEQGKKYHPEIPHFSNLIKGSTLEQIFNKHFEGMEEVQRLIVEELDKFEAQMAYTYIPGVEAFMADLRRHNVKTAIVTSSNNSKMEQVYKIHPELKEQIDLILTAEHFTKSKPDPECFLMAAKLLNAQPENSIVFEDSFNGLEAGNRAQMQVIALSTTNPYEHIKDKARLVIKDFEGFTYKRMIEAIS